MRVRCINHIDYEGDAHPYGPNDPKIGDECEVKGECIGWGTCGSECPCFILKGYSPYVYDQRNFAIISDLDETTLVNEEWEQKVCEPVNDRP